MHESGWGEQGGIITTGTASSSATGNTTVAFTKNMANTSYTFTCCGQTSSAVTGSNHARIMTFGYITKTTNGITGNANYQSSGGDDYRAGKMMWKVSVQLASGQYPVVKETKRQIIKY